MRGVFADPIFFVLVLLATGLLASLYSRALGGVVILLGTLALYLLATPFVADMLYRIAQTDWASEPPAGDAGAIVVLPAGIIPAAPEYGGDTIDGLSLQRVRYAARLQRSTGLPIMVTGGRPRDATVSNGESMRRVLVDDLGARVAWVEDRARNTEQHAVNGAAILRKQSIGSIILVTHAAHMPRAKASFERAGLSVIPAPTDFAESYLPFSARDLVPRSRALVKSWYAFHELLGRVWYWLSYA